LNRLVVLDTGPTWLAGQSRGRGRSDECRDWIKALKGAGAEVAVPEIARYEVRRELFRAGSIGGLRRLDHLHPGLTFLPITSQIMDIASELWAHVRRAGLPTAPDDGLDGDAIVAATAIVAAQSVDEVIIATENVGHLARFPGVDARDWWTIG
jgi:predicted nucleic acid-binding protein